MNIENCRFTRFCVLILALTGCLATDPERGVHGNQIQHSGATEELQTTTAPPSLDPAILESRSFGEAPILAEQVKRGDLPPISERLPENPLVVVPLEEIGQYGGTLRRGLTGDIIQTAGVNKTLSDGLLGFERPVPNSIQFNLAEGYEFSEDGRQATFKIRKGVRWSDGHPFTVDDILFWYYDTQFDDNARAPNNPIPPTVFTVDGKPIKLEKIDDYTLRASSTKPLGRILNAFCGDVHARPKHVMSKYHPRYNPEATYDDFKERATDSMLLYEPGLPKLSAWIPVEWVRGQRIVYERNPYYWKVDSAGNQLPYADRLVFNVIADPQVILLKFINGELDLFGRYSRIDMYPTLKTEEASGKFKVVLVGPGRGPSFYLNWDAPTPNIRKAFRNKNIRIAMSHAINREEINSIIYHGLLVPSGYTFGKQNPYFSEEAFKRYTRFDPDLANQLLDKEGYADTDADGWRNHPDGTRFEITVDVRGPGVEVDICELVQAQWQAVGIKTNLNISLRDIIWPRRLNGEFDIHHWSLEGPDDPLGRPQDWSSMLPTTPFWHREAYNHGETEWLTEATRHIEAAMTAVDTAVVRQHMEAVRDLHTENVPVIVVGSPYHVWGASTQLGNVPNDGSAADVFRGWGRPVYHEQLYFKRGQRPRTSRDSLQ